MAKNAGVDAVAVSYGAHPRDVLDEVASVYCAASVGDLAAWLAENA
jgi:phosphoglycolate phosphatase